MERTVVCFISRISLQIDFYMIRKDQVFAFDVVVIDPIRKTMISNVINRSTSANAKPNTIAKIHKYKGLHERHHFISMAMKVYGAFG
jgi:hypothetical protein